MLRLLLTALCLSCAGAYAQDVLLGSSDSVVTEAKFFTHPYNEYRISVQIVPSQNTFVATNVGNGYHALEAATYPVYNHLDSTGDLRTQLAYTQAYWNIARFQAKRHQARLRRELGFPRLFNGISDYAVRSQNLYNLNQAEWNDLVRQLDVETSNAEPLLTSIAFAEEYARALDTITMPQLAYAPAGIWVYIGMGGGPLLGEAGRGVNTAGNFDLGLGYRHRRLRAGYSISVSFLSNRRFDGAAPVFVDGRAQYNNFSFLLGYDLGYSTRAATTAYVHLGGSALKTGSGDDQVKLDDRFLPGIALESRVRLGKARPASFYQGLKPRHVFTLYGRATATRQFDLAGDPGLLLNLTAGLYIDASTFRYRRPGESDSGY